MDAVLYLGAALLYLAGHYGARLLRMTAKRGVIPPPTVAGLAVLFLGAAVIAYLWLPSDASDFEWSFVVGLLALPTVLVSVVVMGRSFFHWRGSRKPEIK
jgi:hypothetical protein